MNACYDFSLWKYDSMYLITTLHYASLSRAHAVLSIEII